LTDSVIDLMAERADVAIRAGPLGESRLVARKLGQSPVVVVAAPSYLEVHGTPLTPADLDTHNRMGFGFVRHIDGWPFLDAQGNAVMIPITGNALVS
ncbi:LysR family transcriptional regulator, partial [bacterium M00.F.Ca.ET.229.01.1.1]